MSLPIEAARQLQKLAAKAWDKALSQEQRDEMDFTSFVIGYAADRGVSTVTV